MKLNTSLFICLFFSAIIAIKAADYDNEEYEYSSSENEDDSSVDDQKQEQEEDDQGEAGNQLQEPQAATFQYKPSKRVEDMENNLPNSSKEFVKDGKVKDTMIDNFRSAMATDEAISGFNNVSHEWQLMLEGPEASRVIGTFGQNFNTIVTSTNAADMINMLATTMHVLLTKAGEEKMSTGLSDIMSLTYSLFTSPNMPEIVNKTGGLVITAVDKTNAALFVKTYWDEIKKLLGDEKLNEKLNLYFTNIASMMKSLTQMMQGGKQLRRTRTNA